MANTIESDRDYVANVARRLVRAGYESREEIIETISRDIADDGIADLSASELVDAEIGLLIAESASWPPVTDFDRLNDAFARLEDSGIVMRQNFTCCGTCGAAEIGYEIDSFREQGRLALGYGFFHQQGTESAVDGYGLNFSYGSAEQDASDDAHIAIGRLVADEMRRAGLKVKWNGKLSMCIMVGLSWHRRWNSECRYTQQG